MLSPEQLRILDRLHKALTLHHHPSTDRGESRAAALQAQRMGERATECGISGALLVAVGAAAREQLPLEAALESSDDAGGRPRRARPAKPEPRADPGPDAQRRRPENARRAKKRPTPGKETKGAANRATDDEATKEPTKEPTKEATRGTNTTDGPRAAEEPSQSGHRRTRRSSRVDPSKAWESAIELRHNVDIALAAEIAAHVGATLLQDRRTGLSMVGGTAVQVAEFARAYQAAVDRAARGS